LKVYFRTNFNKKVRIGHLSRTYNLYLDLKKFYNCKVVIGKKKKIIFPGYFVCGNKLSISELLISIKWQNTTMDKISDDKICAIVVPKNNLFSNAHSKYFNYKILDEKNKLYAQLKKLKSFNKKFNIYTR